MKINQYILSEYKKELGFYRQYHQHPWNNAIHFVCVPLESLGVIISLYGVIRVLISGGEVVSDICLWIYCGFHFMYYLLPPLSAPLSSLYFLVTPICAHASVKTFGAYMSVLISTIIGVFAWFCQIVIGHLLIEKNLPAMTRKLTLNSICLSVLLSSETRYPEIQRMDYLRDD